MQMLSAASDWPWSGCREGPGAAQQPKTNPLARAPYRGNKVSDPFEVVLTIQCDKDRNVPI